MIYNKQLIKDRRSRLPYVDAQTGIAQTNSHLLRSRLERRRGALPGQIYSYPPYRWRQEAKPAVLLKKGIICPNITYRFFLSTLCLCIFFSILLADTLLLEPMAVQGAPPTTGLIQSVEGGVLTKRSSRLAGVNRPKDPAVDGQWLLFDVLAVSCTCLLNDKLKFCTMYLAD